MPADGGSGAHMSGLRLLGTIGAPIGLAVLPVALGVGGLLPYLFRDLKYA